MEGDPVEQVEAEVRMGLFVGAHALEETVHPELPAGILWAIAYPVELAQFRAKYLDRGVILVHGKGELDKGLRIGCDGEGFAGVWIEELIGFIAHRPEFDGMERRMGVGAGALMTMQVIHVIYPAPRQVGPSRQRGMPAGYSCEVRLDH